MNEEETCPEWCPLTESKYCPTDKSDCPLLSSETLDGLVRCPKREESEEPEQ